MSHWKLRKTEAQALLIAVDHRQFLFESLSLAVSGCHFQWAAGL
jgi:hypothetical protein